jgi:hypothetical protein
VEINGNWPWERTRLAQEARDADEARHRAEG